MGIGFFAEGNAWFNDSFVKPKGAHRRSRHLKSQMKFFGGPRFKKAVADSGWKFATKPRDGRIGQFGL